MRTFATFAVLAGALVVASPARAQTAQTGVLDLYRHPQATIELLIPVSYSSAHSGVTYGQLTRSPGGAVSGTGTSTHTAPSGYQIVFDNGWSPDVRYQYTLPYTTWSETYNQATGMWDQTSTTGAITFHVTVRQSFATANQSVDSRLDLRYATERFKDFKFEDRTYRGGLFAGYNADGARVGRAYLKFALQGPIQSGEQLWDAGGVEAYSPRLARTGTANLRLVAAGNGWTQNNLVWSNAPALVTTTAYPFQVSWDAASPAGKWLRLGGVKLVENALSTNTDGAITLVIQSASETSTAWAYFAKSQYRQDNAGGFGPVLLYAFGGNGATAPGGGGQP